MEVALFSAGLITGLLNGGWGSLSGSDGGRGSGGSGCSHAVCFKTKRLTNQQSQPHINRMAINPMWIYEKTITEYDQTTPIYKKHALECDKHHRYTTDDG